MKATRLVNLCSEQKGVHYVDDLTAVKWWIPGQSHLYAIHAPNLTCFLNEKRYYTTLPGFVKDKVYKGTFCYGQMHNLEFNVYAKIKCLDRVLVRATCIMISLGIIIIYKCC